MKLSLLDKHRSVHFTHYDSSLQFHILQQFSACRRDNRFIDLEVQVGEVVFPCHQLLLDAFCPYFTAYFSFHERRGGGGGREGEEVRGMERVSLKYSGVSVKGFSKLLDFMYTAELEVTTDDVIEVLRCADFLQFHQVVHLCSSFLQQHIDSDTCLQVLVLAQAHDLHDLSDKALTFILSNFTEVMSQGEFTQLSRDCLVAIISSPRLQLQTEATVVQAVFVWVTASEHERLPLLHELLQHARLRHVDLKHFGKQTFRREIVEQFQNIADMEDVEGLMLENVSPRDDVRDLTSDNKTDETVDSLKHRHSVKDSPQDRITEATFDSVSQRSRPTVRDSVVDTKTEASLDSLREKDGIRNSAVHSITAHSMTETVLDDLAHKDDVRDSEGDSMITDSTFVNLTQSATAGDATSESHTQRDNNIRDSATDAMITDSAVDNLSHNDTKGDSEVDNLTQRKTVGDSSVVDITDATVASHTQRDHVTDSAVDTMADPTADRLRRGDNIKDLAVDTATVSAADSNAYLYTNTDTNIDRITHSVVENMTHQDDMRNATVGTISNPAVDSMTYSSHNSKTHTTADSITDWAIHSLKESPLPDRLTEVLVVISRETECKRRGVYHDRKTVYSYDPEAMRWETLTSIPFEGREGYSATVLNNVLYLTGGQNLDINDIYCNKIIFNENWAFDPLEDRWEERQSMMVPRYNHSAAAMLNKLYIVGGRASSSYSLRGDGEVYDPLTNQWTFIASVRCINGIGNAALTSLDGKLYLVGGTFYNPDRRTSIPYESYQGAQVYHPQENLWQELLPLERDISRRNLRLSSTGLVAVEGFLLLLDDNVGTSHQLYNPVSQTLTSLMQAHGHHWFAGWAVHQGRLVCTGGLEDGRMGMTDLVHAWDLTGAEAGWKMMPSLPLPMSHHACVTMFLNLPRPGAASFSPELSD